MAIHYTAETWAPTSLGRLSGRIVRRLLIPVLLGAFFSGNAWAQLPPPPKTPAIDAYGVDVRTGNPTYERPELDIGPPGEMGLHFARYLSGGVERNSLDST